MRGIYYNIATVVVIGINNIVTMALIGVKVVLIIYNSGCDWLNKTDTLYDLYHRIFDSGVY